MTTLFAFLHHLLAFTLVAALAVEFILLGFTRSEPLTLPVARRLVVADAVLGASATLLLLVGLLRVFYFEKGSAYYFQSHAFMAKFSIFIAVALLSIVPTVQFRAWLKALKASGAADAGRVRMVRKLLHGELLAVVLILLFAAIMARGGWV